MSKNPTLDFGPVRPDEIGPLNGLLEQALSFPVGHMAPWTEVIGHEHMRAVRRDGRAVAGMSVIPMGHYFGGRSVPAGGITAVGVAPDQRGTGVGLWMLQQSVLELARQGLPLATLYPATTAFYRRSGFERAAHRLTYEIPLASLGVRDYALEAVPAGPEHYDTIKSLYQQYAARGSAMIDRPDFYWKQILEPKDKPAHRFLALRDGVPEGYVVFLHATWGEMLQVRDIAALSPGAGRRLLTLLADHRSMLEKARIFGGPSDTVLFLMGEQHHKLVNSIDLMVRILNVPGALAARGYPAGLSAELHLEVSDDLVPANNGRFLLQVAGGEGRAEPGGEGLLRASIRGLAALYSGYLSPRELQALELIDGPPEALATAELLFGGQRPWLPDMF